MEPFRLTPQSIAFLSVMAGVTVVVAVAAPFGSIALGAVALLAIGVVLIKAMLRARRWWPLTFLLSALDPRVEFRALVSI